MAGYNIAIAEHPLLEGGVSFYEEPTMSGIEDFDAVKKDLQPTLKALEEGAFLLTRPQFDALETGGVEAQLFESDEFSYGRHKNSHGLVFGQLALSSECDRGKQVHVALKPLDTARIALHEYAATLYVNGFGGAAGPLSFVPLGFYRMPDQFALVTEYDPKVTSFDNVFWDSEKPPTDKEVEKALSFCVAGLARLHAFGLVHHDAQVKNLAADNKGPRFIDLESVELFSRTDEEVDVEKVRAGTIADLETFASSLSTGIEEGDVDYRLPLEKALQAYLGYVRHPASQVPRDVVLTESDIQRIAEASYMESA
jgi:hypothetical protein